MLLISLMTKLVHMYNKQDLTFRLQPELKQTG